MTLVDAFNKVYKDGKDYTDSKISGLTILTVSDVSDLIAQLTTGGQKWKPSVALYSNLPVISGGEQSFDWLCMVRKTENAGQPTEKLKGVYQRVAGSSSTWVLYSTVSDTVDPIELAQAIDDHNTSGTAHTDIRGLITTLDGNVVKTSGNQNISGIKTFTNEPIVPNPTTNTAAANKIYVDTTVGNLRTEIESTINTISSTFRSNNSLD